MSIYNEATITDLVIGMLYSCRSTRMMRAKIYERIKNRERLSTERSIQRMIKRGILVKDGNYIKLSKKAKKLELYRMEKSPFAPDAPKDLMILFDIPERQRKTRDWLRRQLEMFDYEMIQKSAWIGPSPLPKNFLKKFDEMDIRKSIVFFKAKKRKL